MSMVTVNAAGPKINMTKMLNVLAINLKRAASLLVVVTINIITNVPAQPE